MEIKLNCSWNLLKQLNKTIMGLSFIIVLFNDKMYRYFCKWSMNNKSPISCLMLIGCHNYHWHLLSGLQQLMQWYAAVLASVSCRMAANTPATGSGSGEQLAMCGILQLADTRRPGPWLSAIIADTAKPWASISVIRLKNKETESPSDFLKDCWHI